MCDQLLATLSDLGYKLNKSNDYYQCAAIYRQGDDPTSVAIYPKKNLCIDFVTNEKFSIQGLIKRTLNLKTTEEVNEWLAKRNITISITSAKPDIIEPKIFDKEILKEILPQYDYFINRGISIDILKRFQSGTVLAGRMANRYVFPIFNKKEELVGLTGRALLSDQKAKWKHLGNKSNWCWPFYLNARILLQKKEIILVESPACVLSLFECGIENCACIFGTDISTYFLNILIRYDFNKIFVATNNEPDNNNIGNLAATKLERKLLKYFDKHQIVVKLPILKDFNEMLVKEGKQSIIDWCKEKN